MRADVELGVLCSIYLNGGVEWAIVPDEYDSVYAKWSTYRTVADAPNIIVDCTQPSGAEFSVLVGDIIGMHRASRESRALMRARQLAAEDEARADGIIDS